MAHEWKVGDRFSIEGVITKTADHAGDYKAIFDGNDGDGYIVAAEMACAKLIKPAAPEPQKLDVTKPMRVIADSVLSITYVAFDPVMNMIYVRYPNGRIDCYPPEELENIPEPKRTYEQIVELVPFFDGIRIVEPGDPFKFVGIKSRAKISYVEGEGWSIEEES